jgi:hypothetical protein
MYYEQADLMVHEDTTELEPLISMLVYMKILNIVKLKINQPI